MKIETLVGIVKKHARLEAEVADAERAISHGGGADTMKWKRQALEDARRFLHEFEEREVESTGENDLW